MRRGELYRISKPPGTDPRKFRVFVIVGRQHSIDSRFSTVICAPVYSQHDDLASQVPVGINEGLAHESSIYCDELISLPKSRLTSFVGMLSPRKISDLNQALRVALDIPN
ncbi:hypothetical protein MNBD_CHLOROFLEXI01-1144 [hydrothermal vent metagenome]|uniref:Death on curing protein, Doc toxin n=1 Tax=hydrothermal vent metagenome TaxID=652676 RepID=A0A3B0V4M7_9ZZZZ